MSELVSIIMPSYNTAQYIGNSIQSVLMQTYTNWELIIVDDCSEDETDAVVNPFLSDARIRYIKNESRCGAAVSRNRALKEATGKWIAFLDSDDLWLPEKLEKQIRFMNENNYVFSYTNYRKIDSESVLKGISVTGPHRVTKRKMYACNWVGCLTVMYDRESVGLIQIKDIKKRNDYAIWLKVSQKADCFLLNECLAEYRVRKNSVSSTTYTDLLRWHYKMFRECENLGVISSVAHTFCNLFFCTVKKLVYEKKS